MHFSHIKISTVAIGGLHVPLAKLAKTLMLTSKKLKKTFLNGELVQYLHNETFLSIFSFYKKELNQATITGRFC